jgi:hypothetical protein
MFGMKSQFTGGVKNAVSLSLSTRRYFPKLIASLKVQTTTLPALTAQHTRH